MLIKPCRYALLCAGTLMFPGAAALAQSTINDTEPFAWGESIGWINFRPSPADGVVVTGNYLSGFAWSESMGWIYVGGVPDNSTQYTQGLNDTGVNNDGAGNLSGFAWGENIGWINFDTSGSGGSQVTVDASGQMHGFAWGENVGWINLDSGYGVLNIAYSGLPPELWMMD